MEILLVKGGCNLGFVYSFLWCSKQFNKGVVTLTTDDEA